MLINTLDEKAKEKDTEHIHAIRGFFLLLFALDTVNSC